MGKGRRRTPELTIGLDLGDRFSRLCGVDRSGEVVEEGRLQTTEASLRRRFGGAVRCRVVVEVGTHSPWASRLLRELGHEVWVANPRQLRLIYRNERKSDRVDAEYLARIGRLDPKLLAPVAHRGRETQAYLAVLRSREVLVGARTRLVNHMRGAVKSVGGRLPRCSTESFPKKVRGGIPEELEPALVPKQRDSGDSEPQLRISKAGDPMLRRLLVGSAQYILGPFGPDTELRRWGLKLAERGGKAAKKRATVAVAHKLAVLLHSLWLTGEVYEPLRDEEAEVVEAAA